MTPADDILDDSSQQSSDSTAADTTKLSRTGEIVTKCVGVPLAVAVIGCIAVSDAVDSVLDPLKAGANKVINAAGKVAGKVANKAYDQIQEFADGKMNNMVKADSSTVKLLKGTGQIGWGLLRGGLAISGLLGHGLAGYMTKRHNSYAASQIVKHGFEDAAHHIQEGAGSFTEGLHERLRK